MTLPPHDPAEPGGRSVTADDRRAIRQAGREAHEAGLTIETNPHPADQPVARRLWAWGWRDAEADDQAAREAFWNANAGRSRQ